MSKIDDLITKLCPNGVEYKKLKDIGDTFTGLSGKGKDDFVDGNCRYITYVNIYNNPSTNLESNDYVKVGDGEKQNTLIKGDILIAGSSENLEDSGMISVVTTEPTENIYLNSFCFGFRLNDDIRIKVLPDFAKHYFRCKTFRDKITSCSFGVTRYNLNKKMFLDLSLPIPPLEVQEEIVRILDQFSKLEEQLEEQLEKRKLQYDFWRAKLFEFETVEEVSLIDVCDYVDYRGKTPKKVESGIFLVTAKNVKEGFIDYECSKEYIDIDDYENVMRRGKPNLGDVLFTTEAPCGHVAQIDNIDIALAQRVIKYSTKNSERLDNTYLKYVLLSPQFQRKLDSKSNGSTVKGVKGSVLHKMTIPMPNIQVQMKIVNILNRFDKLINDVNEGIPAEIEARRKQYEYYRNKLLSFKELPNE